MSPSMIKLGLLSLISSALAIPVYPSGTGAPYEAGNGTYVYSPSATGRHHHHNSTRTRTRGHRSSAAATLVSLSSDISAAAISSSEAAAEDTTLTTSCTSSETVYTTTTERIYVTVTPSAVAGAGTAASSDGYATISNRDAQRRPWRSSSKTSTSSSKAAAASSTIRPSSSAAAAAATSRAAASSVAVAATSTSAAPAVRSAAASAGKRGIAYNDATLCNAFVGKPLVSWAYNWGQTSSGLNAAFEYVPMLWGTASMFTGNWVSNAKAAIAAGSTHLLAFNEPDLGAQSNLSPAAAAAAYKTYMHNNFAGQNVRLGSPAVTNGGGAMGLAWLGDFLTQCAGCQVDFVAVHWYDSATNIDYFKNHIQQAHTATGKPVWLTEFGASGSDAQVSAFLEAVMPWLDSQDYVERYSYFMASPGKLISGSGLSSYGSTFATYSA